MAAIAARALVTENGVYAFLESPENRRFLKDVKPGSAVDVKWRLLMSGSLLRIDSLSNRTPPVVLKARKRRKSP